MNNFLDAIGARKVFNFLLNIIDKKADKSRAITTLSITNTGNLNCLNTNGELILSLSLNSLMTNGSNRKSGNYITKEILKNGQICFQCSETEIVPASNGLYNSDTKVMTTLEFDPFSVILCYKSSSSTAIAANNSVKSSYLFEYCNFNLQTVFNLSSFSTHKDVFIKCSPQSNGKVKLATTNTLVLDLPTTEDEFVYILLGRIGLSLSDTLLTINHPVYYYKGGALRLWTNPATVDISGKADSATTLADYGITDAKIENGTITLGSNTITPLTTHLSLTNYVTLNGNQTITGEKTFSGDKRVKFKQSAAANKLGFTLYNTSSKEVGNFEWLPSGINSKPTIALGLWRESTATALGYVAIKMNDIPGSAYYTLVTPFPADAKTPLGLSSTVKVLYFPLQFKNGSNTVLTASTGVVDLSTLVGDYLTQTTFDTNNADLAAIEGLTGTEGVLIKTAANTWALSNTVGATPIVDHGTSDTTFALTSNIYHKWGSVSSLTLTLATPDDVSVMNEYIFSFTSPATPTTLSVPASVNWVTPLDIEANKEYRVSIIDNLATWITSNMVVPVGDVNTPEYATKAYVDAGLALKEDSSNKVTSVDENSTNTQYPSAKAMYDALNPE